MNSPGPARVGITTLGCKVNYAEMAALAGELAADGFDVVADSEPADVRVLNSCTVTAQADATTRHRLRRLHRTDPASHVIVTGCSVDANPGVYGTGTSGRDLGDVAFDNARKGEIGAYIRRRFATVGATPTAPRLRARAFLKAQDGCNHRCTYCSVWSARGASRSVPAADLAATAQRMVAEGHREVVLTGVDLGSYGRDIGTRLADLLPTLLDTVSGAARLRLSSINANDIGDSLIALAAHPALCPHWHIPLQSGSNTVLRRMHRGYSRERYVDVVERLRRTNPAIEVTSDIMTAFPGESEEDHAATLALIDEVAFLDAHVFRYSARPETPAAAMDGRVDAETARRRSAEIQHAVATGARVRYAALQGATVEVVWNGDEDGSARGVTATYHQAEREGALPVPGSCERVRVTAVADRRLVVAAADGEIRG